MKAFPKTAVKNTAAEAEVRGLTEMKRIISLLLCAVLVTVFAACSVPEVPPTDETATKTTEKPTVPGQVPTDPETQPETIPGTEPVTDTPTAPATDPVTENPTRESTEPVTVQPTEPPTQSPTEPETEPVTEDIRQDAADRFYVAKAFGDNMVIQRNEYITVWGRAPEEENGKTLTGYFAGMEASCTIENERWEMTFPETLPASTEPKSLVIRGNDIEEEFTGILVGDVYWVLGQSNIDYSVSKMNSEAASFEGKNPKITNGDNIRLMRNSFTYDTGIEKGTTILAEECQSKYGWQMPSKGAPAFSAIGYLFAKQIIAATNNGIPLGIIEFEANGQAVNVFFPNELADRMKIDSENPQGIYHAVSANGDLPTRFMYNQYMYPLQKLKIAGIVWYQGESDNSPENEKVYGERLAALLTEYRSRHDQINHDYPVYIIEFPTIYFGYDFGAVRGQLARAASMIPNAYVSASLDLWNEPNYGDAMNQLHPYCKPGQAKRAADIALSVTYGIGDTDFVTGPMATSVSISRNTATVKFIHVADGLKTSRIGSEVKGFQVYSYGSWSNAYAEISGKDTVTVSADQSFSAVRYGCIYNSCYPDNATLANSENIPAVSFSTMGSD